MSIIWNGGCGQGGGAYLAGPGIQINQNEISADVRRDMITLPEVSPAEMPHAIREYLIYNNGLYRVIAAIAAGDMLVPDTNIKQTSIGAEIHLLYADLAVKFSSISTQHTVTQNGLYRSGNVVSFHFVGTLSSAVAQYDTIGIVPEGFRPHINDYFGDYAINASGLFQAMKPLAAGTTIRTSTCYVCRN